MGLAVDVELLEEFLGLRTGEAGYLDAVGGEHVGLHDCGTSGVGDDADPASLRLGVHHGGGHCHQLGAAVAPYDAGLAEEGADGLVG